MGKNHHHNDRICGGVAQPDRARGSYPLGRWFKSTLRHQFPAARALCGLLAVCALLSATALAYGQTSDPTLFDTLSRSNIKKPVKVEKVINAGSLRLEDGRRIKLIGLKALDAPRPKPILRDEKGMIIEQEPDPILTVDQRALDYARELLEGQAVTVEFDVQYRDDQSDILGYVFLADGTLANAEILRQGFAELSMTPANTKYSQALRDAYREARMEKRGLQGN